MATKILTEYKQKLESLELQPSSGGCFELTVDSEVVYSKLATDQFPVEDDMVAEIGKRF